MTVSNFQLRPIVLSCVCMIRPERMKNRGFIHAVTAASLPLSLLCRHSEADGFGRTGREGRGYTLSLCTTLQFLHTPFFKSHARKTSSLSLLPHYQKQKRRRDQKSEEVISNPPFGADRSSLASSSSSYQFGDRHRH